MWNFSAVGVIFTGLILIGMAGSNSQPASPVVKNPDNRKLVTTQVQPQTSPKTKTATTAKPAPKPAPAPKPKPTCDGTKVTADCVVDGVAYKTYVFHPAVAEKSHQEGSTTYKDEITGYCTLCNDGTRSPTCATGRGTCSYHGGVQQWNAPIYTKTAVTETHTVIDSPAQAEFYDKVPA